MSDVTRILRAIEQGDPLAANELLPLVYKELRGLAAHKMAGLQAGQTLQPTALVHEAWLRLVGNENPKFKDRSHFFAAAAQAMRHMIIESIRRKRAERHGGGLQRVDLDRIEISTANSEDHLLAVNEALDQLEKQQPLQAEVVKLRFFVGMTNEEAAEVLGINARQVKYYWTHARTWLYREITLKN